MKVSTVPHPFNFFLDFFSSDYIDQLRTGFFPDPNDSQHYFSNKSIIEINLQEEYVEYSQEVDTNWEIDDTIPDYPVMVVTDQVLVHVRIDFFKHLKSIFYQEVQTTLGLCHQAISDSRIRSVKAKLSIWMGLLERFIGAADSEKYSRYPDLKWCVESMIQELYKFYQIHCPRPNDVIRKVLSGSPVPLKERWTLKPGFHKALARITNDKDEHLIDAESAEIRVRHILSICCWTFDELPPIVFKWNNNAVFYLLRKIRRYSETEVKLQDIIDCGKFTFKSNKVTRSSMDNAPNNLKNARLKEKIDLLITDYLQLED